MSQNELLTCVIIGTGQQELTLYPPASEFYRRLRSAKEINRLHKLRHLGSLSSAFQGARQARWDYTLAMLYYIQQLEVSGFNSVFRIGGVQFSSAKAALQTLALAWNIGHLPGTFAVEKGVYRYLLRCDTSDPLSFLDWPFSQNQEVSILRDAARALVERDDYRCLSRVLAVLKLLQFAAGTTDLMYRLLTDFIGPFFLDTDGPRSVQWPKLRRAFKLVRHLAYLTLDGPYAGLQWAPNVPALLSHAASRDAANLFSVDEAISEVLSPLEKAVYESIYHHPEVRRDVAIMATHICNHLDSASDPKRTIMQWLRGGLYRELRVGRRPPANSFNRVATVRLRSHFLSLRESPAALEAKLDALGISAPLVLEYTSWNTETLLEPDETLIDFFSPSTVEASDIGKIIVWIINEFEDLRAPADDAFAMLCKADLEPAYMALVSQAIQVLNPGFEVRVVPWRLKEFGLFPNVELQDSRGGVWASRADLRSPPVAHVLRDRSRQIGPGMRERYAELMGLRELRRWLRQRSSGNLRCRWLVVTGSIQLLKGSRSIIEFDGAIIQVSARSGRLRILALESKTGKQNPIQSLRRRVAAVGLPGQTHALGRDYAVLDIPL